MGEQMKNITWHNQTVTTKDLEDLHNHKGVTLWFTGLSGSGKSTLANVVASKLLKMGVTTIVLDGDNIRHGLNKNLGFSHSDRTENIRRIGEVAKLFTSAAVVNLTAFISPYRSDRLLARELQPDTFVEVYCKADLDICEKRDPKGLYKKARAGTLANFTGIDAPYEEPINPEITVNTGSFSVEDCSKVVLFYLTSNNLINIIKTL